VNLRFASKKLERLYRDRDYRGGFGVEVVKAFRKRVAIVQNARDERDFYALKSLHFEKLRGSRAHQRSMRLNSQWRLILEIETDQAGNTVVIVSIEDYH